MAIITSRNTGYGGDLVSQKYQPLMDIALEDTDAGICSGLLTNRSAMLKAVGLLDELRLTVPNWADITRIEATPTRLPPLVVVSSARSGWVQKAVRAGKAWLDASPQPFANVSDMNALMDRNNHDYSPPLYAPYRVNDPNRSVYMVVHEYEYQTYKTALAKLFNDGVLAGKPILPVAFSFGRHADKDLLGFGPSRFAAMEFCKSLRRRIVSQNNGKATWNAAWIMDDTTVSLSSFAGFNAVEAALGDNAAAGFQVDTTLHPRDSNLKFAVQEFDAGRGGQAPKLPALLSEKEKADEKKGVLAVCALWNIAAFDTQRFNFGPMFITSAEDTSISKHFVQAKIAYQIYTDITIRKEAAMNESDDGAEKLKRERENLTLWMTGNESKAEESKTPPPPIMVKSSHPDDKDLKDMTLSTFVLRRVLPDSKLKDKKDDPDTQAKAKSHAVEQIASKALSLSRSKGHGSLVSKDAIDATFRINGDGQQNVHLRDA